MFAFQVTHPYAGAEPLTLQSNPAHTPEVDALVGEELDIGVAEWQPVHDCSVAVTPRSLSLVAAATSCPACCQPLQPKGSAKVSARSFIAEQVGVYEVEAINARGQRGRLR